MHYSWNINHRHLRAGVAVDTNLFLLLLVGRYDPNKIGLFRATRKYNQEIFDLLSSLLENFRVVHTTTNILTEVDNLSRQVSSAEWPGVSAELGAMIGPMQERWLPSSELLSREEHPQVGLADCSLLELAARDILIVTDDLPLTIQLEKRRRGVINLSRYIFR